MLSRIKSKIEERGALLLFLAFIGIAVSLFLHYYNPFHSLFTSKEQTAARFEDTPEYKKLKSERDAALDSANLYKGMYQVVKSDYADIMASQKEVQPRYIESVKKVKKLTPQQRHGEYERYKQQQNEELRSEGE